MWKKMNGFLIFSTWNFFFIKIVEHVNYRMIYTLDILSCEENQCNFYKIHGHKGQENILFCFQGKRGILDLLPFPVHLITNLALTVNLLTVVASSSNCFFLSISLSLNFSCNLSILSCDCARMCEYSFWCSSNAAETLSVWKY